MRAVHFTEYGLAEVLQLTDMETPTPRAGEIRIRVAAAGVNPADYKWRSGMFRTIAPTELPHVLGYDIAGTVDALGEGVTGFALGERVVAMLDPYSKGGYAEFALADAAQVAKANAQLDLDIAATLPTPGLTGVQLIEEHVRPQPGETVLVTGAVGAVGRFAVHAARQLGARVVAAVRASQRDLALSLGASSVIVLGETPLDVIRLDHVADTVGGDAVAALCRLLPPSGRIMTVATTPIDPLGLAAAPTFVAVHQDGPMLTAIGDLVAIGAIAVPPVRTMPLSAAAEAHRLMEAGGLGERIVLRP